MQNVPQMQNVAQLRYSLTARRVCPEEAGANEAISGSGPTPPGAPGRISHKSAVLSYYIARENLLENDFEKFYLPQVLRDAFYPLFRTL